VWANGTVETLGDYDAPFGTNALVLGVYTTEDTLLRHMLLRLCVDLRDGKNQSREDRHSLNDKSRWQSFVPCPLPLRLHGRLSLGFPSSSGPVHVGKRISYDEERYLVRRFKPRLPSHPLRQRIRHRLRAPVPLWRCHNCLIESSCSQKDHS
jgi:hypothetical protein